ncbi:MAG: hypothetical protein HC866_23450 [Leptolyngbyaceae cyanobacterium RU_5_1]|nr:hypothetical protein [Leptolyngbyaceae cyanobacterium RU_5_1]
MVTKDFRVLLPLIALSVLLIYGCGNDPAMPGEIGRWMASQLPRAQLLELRAGYSPFWENPDGFNVALSDFAAKH